MNNVRRLQLAQRMDTLLQRALGEGISPQRVLNDALYARDVLLVCDAMPGTELQSLASLYRAAEAQADRHEVVTNKTGRSGPVRPPLRISSLLGSIFGPIDDAPPAASQAQGLKPRRGWFGWSRPKGTAAEHIARRLQDKPDTF